MSATCLGWLGGAAEGGWVTLTSAISCHVPGPLWGICVCMYMCTCMRVSVCEYVCPVANSEESALMAQGALRREKDQGNTGWAAHF